MNLQLIRRVASLEGRQGVNFDLSGRSVQDLTDRELLILIASGEPGQTLARCSNYTDAQLEGIAAPVLVEFEARRSEVPPISGAETSSNGHARFAPANSPANFLGSGASGPTTPSAVQTSALEPKPTDQGGHEHGT